MHRQAKAQKPKRCGAHAEAHRKSHQQQPAGNKDKHLARFSGESKHVLGFAEYCNFPLTGARGEAAVGR